MMLERLLNGPRTIVRDLVSKRLWPVALLLVVALVAVPVVIARSGSDTPPAGPPPSAAATSAANTSISVEAPAVLGRSRPGPVKNPFFSPPKPNSASSTSSSTTTTTSAPTPTTTTPTTTPSSSSSGTATTKPAVVTPPATSTGGVTTPAPSDASIYRTRVRWGTDKTADVRGLSRLEPLGGRSDPALIYLGTSPDHTRAVFLLGPNALADGGGKCVGTTCRIIALKAGESVSVGVLGTEGVEARHYELVVEEIAQVAASSQAEALKLRARVHPDGRDALRAVIKDAKTAGAIGLLRYDAALGAVVPTDAP